MNKVRVRFAPSPTGFLHIGGLRTALFSWLFARKNKGQFILRIEDTDQARTVPGSVENILEALKWYGLNIDEGPIFQSERLGIYNKYVQQLLKQGSAYHCFCSAERLAEIRKIQELNKLPTKYDGLCRSLSAAEVEQKLKSGQPHVVRLKVPESGQTTFNDIIFGQIVVDNKNIDDQVLLKSDGFPTYHLANVVDDHDMGITHVIRAEEWMPSTPKHILLYQAFKWPLPLFAHPPMVLGEDRTKLSKRHGAFPALEYRQLGYLPKAVLNFIALLGWNPKTEKEIFSLAELIQEFDLSKINKSSAIFNIEKLNWLNGQYIKKLSISELAKLCQPYLDASLSVEKLQKIAELFQDRLRVVPEIKQLADFLITDNLKFEAGLLVPPKDKPQEVLKILAVTLSKIESLWSADFNAVSLKDFFENYIGEQKLNNRIVLWPLRVAITGLAKSPGVFEVMEILGKEAVLARISKAIDNLK